jgi:flagellar motor switch/type III secretory pathway protein FliN
MSDPEPDVTPDPSQVFDIPSVPEPEEASVTAPVAPAPRPASPRSLEALPSYARSLLKIKVPVIVTLARKKQPISKIVEIGPGTILQFNKACDQMLELEVNGREIGAGEAVKVGDKFGIRIASLTLPGERFKTVAPRRAS